MNSYLDDETERRRALELGTGIGSEELANNYLASVQPPPLPVPETVEEVEPAEESREDILKKALNIATSAPAVETVSPEAPAPEPESRENLLQRILSGKASVEVPKSAAQKVIQSMYAAGTRQKLPDSFFAQDFQREQQNDAQDHQLAMVGNRKSKAPEEADYSSPNARALQAQFMQDNPDADIKNVMFMTPRDIFQFKERGLKKDRFAEDLRATGVKEKMGAEKFEEDKRKNAVSEDLKKFGLDSDEAKYYGKTVSDYDKSLDKLKNSDAALKQAYGFLPADLASKVLGAEVPDDIKRIRAGDFSNHSKLIKDRLSKRAGIFGNLLRDSMADDTEENRLARKNLQMAFDSFRNTKTNELFGAALSRGDLQRAQLVFQDADFDKPEYMLAAMELFRNIQAQQLASNESVLRTNLPDRVFSELPKYGVLTSHDPFYKNLRKGDAPALTDSGDSLMDQMTRGSTERRLNSGPVERVEEAVVPSIKTKTPISEPRKVYSAKENKTYILDASGEPFDVQDGDTRGE